MPSAPTRDEVIARLSAVLENGDEATRAETASWAQEWILEDDPDTSDPAVWRALVRMVGLTLESGSGYTDEEPTLRAWLADLESSPKP